MKKILILDLGGVVGPHLVESAWEAGLEVHVFYQHQDDLRLINDIPIVSHRINLFNEENLRVALAKYQYNYIVINTDVHTNQEVMYKWHAALPFKLCKLIIEEECELSKLIYISSIRAVGPADLDPSGLISPDSYPRPMSAYGKSKLQGEQFIQQFPVLPWIIIRPGEVYGPQVDNFTRTYRLLRSGIALYPGKSDQQIILTYARNLAEAVIYLIEHGKSFRIHHYGETMRLDTFYLSLAKALGQEVRETQLPSWSLSSIAQINRVLSRSDSSRLLPDRVNECKFHSWASDITSLLRTGYKQRVKTEQAIQETIDWWLKQVNS